jgi:phosphodiesterase/alkaline phosphatase D-like protein
MSRKTKIVFTSCVRHEAFKNQPQWGNIESEDPDYLFLLGDQIYMDFGLPIFSREPNGKPKKYSQEKFKKIMDGKYKKQWDEPHFKHLFEKMKAKNAVFGVWDDHDFAWNNACGNSVKESIKTTSRDLFHKWMDCSTNKPEVYCHIDIPNARVIFLDNRYYADPLCATSGQIGEHKKRSLLGEAQFDYLEDKLNHDKKFTIICSGLTLTHGEENWSKFEEEYERFKNLVKDKKNILFLAGDIHKNKFSKPDKERPCYEIVSSGLAVNYLGLPFGFDDKHNWGIIELDENEILVKLIDKKGSKRYKIDSETWKSKEV